MQTGQEILFNIFQISWLLLINSKFCLNILLKYSEAINTFKICNLKFKYGFLIILNYIDHF